MTHTEVRDKVVQALASIAPEIDPTSLRADQAIRDQIDLDSMDFLRFVIELHTQVGVDIPEVDYPKVATLDSAVGYLAARLATGPPAA